MRKIRKNTWHQLEDEKCPKCGSGLMRNMFVEGYTGCGCGFNVDDNTKKLLVDRDKEQEHGSRIQDDEVDSTNR
jgi:hypothetical protein